MNEEWLSILSGMIPNNMLERGRVVRKNLTSSIKVLFEQRSVPYEGWSNEAIWELIHFLSSMDTDKDAHAARIGEREARTASPLNSYYSGGFNHGVGRSGELIAPQPKAPGTSIMYQLANRIALSFLKHLGLPNVNGAFVAPLSTGMAIALALSYFRKIHRGHEVVYPRADHKSPMKAVELIGGKLKVVEGVINGDEVTIPIEDIHEAVSENTFAILSTTTFFPPRGPDNVKEIAKLARDLEIPHIINNAYGVQSHEIMKRIRSAIDAGRVDVIIQSTDKNFLTPIGGSILASSDSSSLEGISKMYPGRANANPVLQFLISSLSLGLNGYESLRQEQISAKKLLGDLLKEFADDVGEHVLHVYNPVAWAVTMDSKDVRAVGGALYNLRVTGPRAVKKGDFGSCCNEYPHSYITMNAAIGVKKRDITMAVERLRKAYKSV